MAQIHYLVYNAPMGWKTYYGRRDQIDPQEYQEWVIQERVKQRLLQRAYRARKREERGGEPLYPERTLVSMTRWIDARRDKEASAELAEVVHYMRRAARLEGLDFEAWDCIQDRGTAKLLRVMGFELVRRAAGMVVLGIRGAV